MALKGKKPEDVTQSKPKFMISGESGVGKTFFALNFPKPYLIDTEGGATRKQYREKLVAAGGAYFGKEEGSQDFKSVLDEVKSLATTQHGYKTLIIDSFSYLYMLEAAEAELAGGSEFGRDKKEANKPTRQLIKLLEKLDMNVIIICHHKTKWTKQGKNVIDAGSTFDGYDKLEYILDLWIELLKGTPRAFTVKKSRIDGFATDTVMPLTYEKFEQVYGKDVIEKEVKPIVLATAQQIAKVKGLLEIVKVDEGAVSAWFKKIDVEDWAEMSGEQIQKCIDLLDKKLKEALPTESKTKETK